MTTDNKIKMCNEYLCTNNELSPEWIEMITEYREMLIREEEKLHTLVQKMKSDNNRRNEEMRRDYP